MNVYERRAKETAMLFEQPSTTSEIAEAFGISVELAMADLRVFLKRGILKKAGMVGKYTSYAVTRILTVDDFLTRAVSQKKKAESFASELQIPEHLRLMFGYTDVKPKGGRFVDNSDFMPSPVRTAPIKVYPGTSWGDVALRMP